MTRELLLEKICLSDCTYNCVILDSCDCDYCNVKLNELLDEYDKQIRTEVINEYYNKINEKLKTDTNLKNTIREIHDNVAQEMYCKGINDFAILMKETLNHDWATTKISEQIIYNRLFDECDRIAEQLKEQNK